MPITRKCSACGQCHECCVADERDTKSSTTAVRWQRILYEKQPFPDNYVDTSFLSSLVTNANVQHWPYWRLCLSTVAVSERISALVLFMLTFFSMFDGSLPASTLIVLDIVAMAFGSAIILHGARGNRSMAEFKLSIIRSTHRLALLAGVLLGLSPVLQTLTSTYSSDTIWALTFLLMTLHLIAHDYSYINSPEASLGHSTISLSAGIFASVLLASRLYDHISVFAFLLLAFLIFAGFPLVAHEIRASSVVLHGAFSMALYVLTSILLVPISNLLVIIYTASLVFIVFGCPMWLKYLQRYKNEIQGPWDYEGEEEEQVLVG
eukprot:gb/GEZN01013565.1/.p1 GENE.gb/GEZN01013565.1/~~gb/GEZN01013565.1/.p1  ORF type:complete len:321 (+),score=2.02 gb/GEZN01013565.1/:38-1000(+)